ncbi:MAG: neutral/alkaline non-lysosomal ceramidase N-terminal domain-containing protein [Clostridia bacterium]|nr:neutral/alkaline non-lysosomal ceramidase N-terminal domain-containing protein [Clostridia bacterium]
MSLQLGVNVQKITPEIGGHLYGYDPILCSKSLHDDLTATAFYLTDGDSRCIMISATVCLIQTALADTIRDRIEAETGISRANIIINATHTHSGPNVSGDTGWGDIDKEYCDTVFIPQLVEAAKSAVKDTRTVTVGIASGDSLVGINRREFNDNNSIGLGQCPWGCFNPKMTVISFKDEKGDIVANMIHYGAHGTAAGYCDQISRDWSGIMTDALTAVTGGVTAFFNGPEGDVGPRLSNGQTVGNMDYVHELGNKATEDAIRVYRMIDKFTDMPLSCHEGMIAIPLRQRISLDEAEKQLRRYENETVNIAAQKAKYYRSVVESYSNGYEESEALEIPQCVVKLGETVFVTFPYEVFSEVGLRLQKMSDYKNVLSLAVTNGSGGYFVTEDQICLGGYEIDMYETSKVQRYAKHADYHMILETLKNIGGKD